MTQPEALLPETLRALLRYEPDTGYFYRLTGRYAGKLAGSVNPRHGYVTIVIAGRSYRAHRLVWLYVHGRWPDPQVDHRNGITHDNRLDNLREATMQQNNCNRGPKSTNRTGFKGVYRRGLHRFNAKIQVNGKGRTLGNFATAEEASAAYQQAAKELHGEFANY